VEAVTLVQKPGRGRPAKVISRSILEEAFQPTRRISRTKLAKLLGVHRSTLSRNLKRYNISTNFSAITNAELDSLVEDFRKKRPDSGTVYLAGHLASAELRLQRWRVRDAQTRVDGVEVQLRNHRPIVRRVYTVKRPNALWHMDGYHKLILYGFVIHGIVDGYSRKVNVLATYPDCHTYRLAQIVSLVVSTSNSAATVLDAFKTAVEAHGLPSRVRGDRGGENLRVAVYMIRRRGLNRASYMFGS
jgi:hypothetical protein